MLRPTPLPGLPTALIRAVCPRSLRDDVLGDLEEEYRCIEAAAGREAARRWYRRQAVGSSISFAGHHLTTVPRNRLLAGVATGIVAAMAGAAVLGTFLESRLGHPTSADPSLPVLLLVATTCALASAIAGGCASQLATGQRSGSILVVVGAFVLLPEFAFAWEAATVSSLTVFLWAACAATVGMTLGDRLGDTLRHCYSSWAEDQ